jgi:hypothetical protein
LFLRFTKLAEMYTLLYCSAVPAPSTINIFFTLLPSVLIY